MSKFKGSFEELEKKGFKKNFNSNYYYKVERIKNEKKDKHEELYAVIFIDIASREISFEGNDLSLGQEIIDDLYKEG